MIPIPFVAGLTDMASDPEPEQGAVHSLYPSHDPDLVRQIVGAAHFDVPKVKELLKLSPALAKSAWDWGFGDWETALGAASHTGNKEIAELLISYGAKPDIYTWAMLGNLSIVKAMIESTPGLQKAHGPHGITLLKHARAGGESAQEVTQYLTELGDADIEEKDLPLEEAAKGIYLGAYQVGSATKDTFTVTKDREGRLLIRWAGGSDRPLLLVGNHEFAPKGCPNVRIRFDVQEARAASLSVHDMGTAVSAIRVSS